jgi:hypothetical protein
MWETHEFECHRFDAVLYCSVCPSDFPGEEERQAHIQAAHRGLFEKNVKEASLGLCERRKPHDVASLSCPLCLCIPGKSRRNFVTHVGKHMEGIALAALPRKNDSDSSSDSENESRSTISIPVMDEIPEEGQNVSIPRRAIYSCRQCRYEPSGEEKRKASKLRRHERTQHPELERSDKRQHSVDSTTSLPAPSTTQGFKNLAEKSLEIGEIEKPHIVSCICDSDDIEESIIQCETCNTWQHSKCYYFGRRLDSLIDVYHTCVNCVPRAIKRISANRLHPKLSSDEEEVIQTRSKMNSRRKPKSWTRIQSLIKQYASDPDSTRPELDLKGDDLVLESNNDPEPDGEPIMASRGRASVLKRTLNREAEGSSTSKTDNKPVSSVRCICGFDIDPNVYHEDSSIGYIIVRCNMCHLRQHGGCVGLFSRGDVPDYYYCEKCRPDMHTVQTNAVG